MATLVYQRVHIPFSHSHESPHEVFPFDSALASSHSEPQMAQFCRHRHEAKKCETCNTDGGFTLAADGRSCVCDTAKGRDPKKPWSMAVHVSTRAMYFRLREQIWDEIPGFPVEIPYSSKHVGIHGLEERALKIQYP